MNSDYRNGGDYNKNSLNNKTKQELLKLLENDDEVNEMIFKLFRKFQKKGDFKVDVNKYVNEIKKLKSENRNFLSKIEQLENSLHSQEDKKNRLEKEISDYKFQLEDQKDEIEKNKKIISTIENDKTRLEIIEKKYNSISRELHDILEIHKTYLNIKSEHKSFLKSLFKGASVDIFFTCGVQEENLLSLWDYIKTAIIEEKSNIEELERIFKYFFNLYNKIYTNPIYVFLDVQIGDQFDDEKHIRPGTYNYSGKINKVLFEGFYNSNTNEIIRKTIVETY